VLVGLNGFDGCGDGGRVGETLGAWVVTVLIGLDGCGEGGAD
jgi:hypothetical protein